MATAFSALSVVVVLLVVAILHLRALAQTHEVRVLDCPVASGVGHFHDESCYDSEGNLVCKLEEIGLHYHDEICYDEDGNLVCGMEEGGEEHVHGPGCFKTVLVDDEGNAVDGKVGSTETPNTGDETEKVHYKADLRELDEDGEEHVVVTVEADVPADALPEDAKLYVNRLREKPLDDELEVDPSELEKAESEDEADEAKPDETKADEAKADEAKSDEAKADKGESNEPKSHEEKADGTDSDIEKTDGTDSNKEKTHDIEADDTQPALVKDASEKAAEKVEDEAEGKVMGLLALDIAFRDGEGNRVEPAEKVALRVSSDVFGEGDDPYVVHFDDKGDAQLAKPFNSEELESHKIEEREGELVFESKKLEPCVVAVASTDQLLEAGGGETYETMRVDAPAAAGVPSGSELRVSEIGEDNEAYSDYVQQLADTLGEEVDQALVYDISIARGDYEVQPQEAVGVSIDLTSDIAERFDDVRIVHFGADGPEEIEGEKVGQVVSFEATGFSAYAIVPGPASPGPVDPTPITTLDQLAAEASPTHAFILSIPGRNIANCYISNTINNASDSSFVEVGESDASQWYFEQVDPNNPTLYRIYTIPSSGNISYIKNTNKNLVGLVEDQSAASIFEISETGSDLFYIKLQGQNKWLQHSNGGKGVRFWTDNNDAANAPIAITEVGAFHSSEDPYGLGGQTYGLMNYNQTAKGKALLAEESTTAGNLAALPLTVMTKKTDNGDQLFVPDNNDATMWTFTWIADDRYYLTATVDGATKYLRIANDGLSVVDVADDQCAITVIPGTGIHAGEVALKANGVPLTYSGDSSVGFQAHGQVGSEWLHLVSEQSTVPEEYCKVFTADKVSVSADGVTYPDNEDGVVIYTRIWDDDSKKYNYYAIDCDGNLVPCYESSGEIQWVGGQFNRLLWDFVEYDDGDGPTGYYDLKSQYSGKYLSPSLESGSVVSETKPGFNFPGRGEGKYSSQILVWDDVTYSYTGLNVNDTHDAFVTCPKGEALDFFFATMKDMADDGLNTVPTVDHEQYGITMKIIDLDNKNGYMNSFLGDTRGWDADHPFAANTGLLSANLGSNGYPTTFAGNDLANLFDGARQVNHLFIQSMYDSTGYYYFDSSQNFASLQDDNTFKVYKELGTYDTAGNKPSMKHGQFFPFNDITPGVFAKNNGRNLYTQEQERLSTNDPRYNEHLYMIENADPHFAMEISASFIQTPNGLDEWGHDIIYEFTGDDDFWLYVDGELVIDLGGDHSAISGTVNFKTGEVKVNAKHPEENGYTTDLRTIFTEGYKGKNPNWTQEGLNAYLDDIFVPGTNHFREYSHHTMRIFYMERGGSASNLNMRFNLASVKPGTVLLSKKLTGVDKDEGVSAEYPYQIYYKTQREGEAEQTHRLKPGDGASILYKDTDKQVTYKESLTIEGTTYQDVFMLRPDEIAAIEFPVQGEGYVITGYKVVECGVNTTIYDQVNVNGSAATEGAQGSFVEPVNQGGAGSNGGGQSSSDYKDYQIDYASVDDRPEVAFENVVDEDALRTLTFTKKLYSGETGELIPDGLDDTRFKFRLSLGSDFSGSGNLKLANMRTYHVKDRSGNYCEWVPGQNGVPGSFQAIDPPISDFDALGDKKAAASFTTSMYGAIDSIPIGYTVEVREVLAGTDYKIEERPGETPDGYALKGYTQTVTTYPETGDPTTSVSSDNTGVTQVGKDAHIEVSNFKGFGFRANKVWSDKDYMTDRKPTYFALFVDKGSQELELVPGSVRQLAYGSDSVYWFFEKLPVHDDEGRALPFSSYSIYEVQVSTPDAVTVDATTGEVTNYGDLTILSSDAADQGISGVQAADRLTLEGKLKGEENYTPYIYEVHYDRDTAAEAAATDPGDDPSAETNIRVDTVSNERAGVEIKKEDLSGQPLSGARFELKLKGNGSAGSSDTAVGTFTSNDEGEVTIAYLIPGREYALTETMVPQDYRGLVEPLTIVLQANGEVQVTSGSQDVGLFVTLPESSADYSAEHPQRLIVKNQPRSFQAIKVDSITGDPLANVDFELSQWVKIGTTYGWKKLEFGDAATPTILTTDADGVIPWVGNNLPEGRYLLQEKNGLTAYEDLSYDIEFNVSAAGVVSMAKAEQESLLTTSTGEGNTVTYLMTIPNEPKKKRLTFVKVDDSNAQVVLPDAKFDLYELDANGQRKQPALFVDLVSDSSGIVKDADGHTQLALADGTYHLVETQAPEGYAVKPNPVVITIGSDVDGGVKYNEYMTPSSEHSVTPDPGDGVYTITITNSAGYELPSSGGAGTTGLYAVGAVLVAAGALHFARQRRCEA